MENSSNHISLGAVTRSSATFTATHLRSLAQQFTQLADELENQRYDSAAHSWDRLNVNKQCRTIQINILQTKSFAHRSNNHQHHSDNNVNPITDQFSSLNDTQLDAVIERAQTQRGQRHSRAHSATSGS